MTPPVPGSPSVSTCRSSFTPLLSCGSRPAASCVANGAVVSGCFYQPGEAAAYAPLGHTAFTAVKHRRSPRLHLVVAAGGQHHDQRWHGESASWLQSFGAAALSSASFCWALLRCSVCPVLTHTCCAALQNLQKMAFNQRLLLDCPEDKKPPVWWVVKHVTALHTAPPLLTSHYSPPPLLDHPPITHLPPYSTPPTPITPLPPPPHTPLPPPITPPPPLTTHLLPPVPPTFMSPLSLPCFLTHNP